MYGQMLQGMTALEFQSNPEASESFVEAVVESLNTSMVEVFLLGIADISPSSGRRIMLITESAIQVDYTVKFLIQDLGFQETSVASEFLTNRIRSAVSSGAFQVSLLKFGPNALKDISVPSDSIAMLEIKVSYLSLSPSLSPTESPSLGNLRSPNNQTSGNFPLFVVFVIIAGVVVLCVVCGFIIKHHRDQGKKDESRWRQNFEGLVDTTDDRQTSDDAETLNGSTLYGPGHAVSPDVTGTGRLVHQSREVESLQI